ncbi:MAG TPA: iron-sulfur cluster assembly accessory protein [Thiotrichaceae bacterium]|jgi:iron-sulfur cluster assembly protein|nr:iron-sulfur cluster assembly accessory protein [Thiotrichaceae bacterium]HIM08107.1 iron-sulfur cluster assembly accessory protein [Gammaproteobacteria bacterium]
MTTEATMNLTDSAKQHIEKVLAKDENGIGLRIGVKTTGCSGYQYIIETAKEVNAEDKTIVSNGINIIIDEQSLRYLAGTELDFTREGLNSGFKFKNPNVEESCGCGESFSLKEGLEK